MKKKIYRRQLLAILIVMIIIAFFFVMLNNAWLVPVVEHQHDQIIELESKSAKKAEIGDGNIQETVLGEIAQFQTNITTLIAQLQENHTAAIRALQEQLNESQAELL